MSTTKTMITNSPKLPNRMAQDKREIEKYLKVFCSKAAQVIVQSRLGEKCQTFSNPRSLSNDWFNLTIDDEPDILAETKKVIDTKQGESIIQRLPLCVEISLRTVDGDKMILEVWSLSCNKQVIDKQARVSHSIYNRMGTLLKSLILVTRSTPAYKLSRKQSTESYKIFYHIFTGYPSIHNLGEGFKEHIIGDLNTNIGQLRMAVAYRTKMTISPTQTGRDTALMLKSDHFNDISPKTTRYHIKKTERKVIDLDKPLLSGAFVDLTKITQFTEQDYILPEMPTFKWLAKNTKAETIVSQMLDNEKKSNSNKDLSVSPDNNQQKNLINNNKNNSTTNNNNNNNNTIVNSININNNNISNSDNSNSNSDNNNNSDSNSINNENNNNQNINAKIDTRTSDCSLGKEDRVRFGSTKTLPPEDDRILKEMNFPFATATPMKDLAKFYRDCFNAPPLHVFTTESPPSSLNGDAVNNAAAEEIFETEVDNEADSLTRQLEKFETSLGDFDSLVTSLCCHSVDANSNS